MHSKEKATSFLTIFSCLVVIENVTREFDIHRFSVGWSQPDFDISQRRDCWSLFGHQRGRTHVGMNWMQILEGVYQGNGGNNKPNITLQGLFKMSWHFEWKRGWWFCPHCCTLFSWCMGRANVRTLTILHHFISFLFAFSSGSGRHLRWYLSPV